MQCFRPIHRAEAPEHEYVTLAFCRLPSASCWLQRPPLSNPPIASGRSGAARTATGVSRTATPPIEWSENEEHPLEGRDPRPRIGDRPSSGAIACIVLTAVPAGVTGDARTRRSARTPVAHKYVVMAIDRKTGKTVWEQHGARRERRTKPRIPRTARGPRPRPSIDGEHVIASFESRGLYAYDMNGKLVWQKDLGDKRMRNTFGEGSTPALHGNHLVVVWDHQGESFIVALDKRTGDELWRATAKEIDTWATPLVVDGQRQAAGDRHRRDEPDHELRPRDRRRRLGHRRA